MTRNIELLETNFSLVYSNSIPSTYDGNGNIIYAPIQPLLMPIVFDKSIISIDVNTNIPSGSQWVYAGTLNRIIPIGTTNHKLNENKTLSVGGNIIIFEKLTINYQIEISVPKWFENLDISVYQYEGIDS